MKYDYKDDLIVILIGLSIIVAITLVVYFVVSLPTIVAWVQTLHIIFQIFFGVLASVIVLIVMVVASE